MKRTFHTALALAALAAPLAAQMTSEQRLFDFQALAAMYSRNYAPYEWKKQVFGFDLLDLKPWLERVRLAKDDLDFYEICAAYVAGLNDAHSTFRLPSTFSATLGFTADIYDGKLIIDGISRSRLSTADYPFEIGDELVSIDSRPVGEWLNLLEKYSYGANPRSARRRAAERLTIRSQSWIPRAHEMIGDEALVEIRRQSGGLETYRIPWVRNGVPLTEAGRVPSPKAAPRRTSADMGPPDYMRPLADLWRDEVPEWSESEALGVGSLAPVWRLPDGFERRLGRTGDFFSSGLYTAGEFRIAYIRIPSFTPASTTRALRQFESEIEFFEENSDGLIVDVMRNPGGDACYNEEIQRRLIPYPFRGIGREIRASRARVNQFSEALEAARRQKADDWVLQLLEAVLKEVMTAYSEQRGRTGPLPVCTASLDRTPAGVVYSRPLMILADEFSTSAADGFTAVLQDAARGPVFGMRTRGAGGSIGSFAFGIFSEASASATLTMHHRNHPVVTAEYPTAPYVENIGVRPDIQFDYMTLENLLSGGRVFTAAFTAAMVEHLERNR